MKNFIFSVFLLCVLTALVSWVDYRPTEKLHGYGPGTEHKGESGLVVPGDGEEMANTNIEPGSIPEPPEDEQEGGTQVMDDIKTQIEKIKTGITPYSPEEITMEELNKMDITAFWHGVAAVLIGEASALMVAFAWTKLRGSK